MGEFSHRHRYLYRCTGCLHEETVIRNVGSEKQECRAEGHYCVGVVYVDACHECSLVYATYDNFKRLVNVDWRAMVEELRAASQAEG